VTVYIRKSDGARFTEAAVANAIGGGVARAEDFVPEDAAVASKTDKPKAEKAKKPDSPKAKLGKKK
jgi:hypothetical protein